MIVRGATDIAESGQKLDELEQQLKTRLEKAKEIASSCSLDDPNLKTQ